MRGWRRSRDCCWSHMVRCRSRRPRPCRCSPQRAVCMLLFTPLLSSSLLPAARRKRHHHSHHKTNTQPRGRRRRVCAGSWLLGNSLSSTDACGGTGSSLPRLHAWRGSRCWGATGCCACMTCWAPARGSGLRRRLRCAGCRCVCLRVRAIAASPGFARATADARAENPSQLPELQVDDDAVYKGGDIAMREPSHGGHVSLPAGWPAAHQQRGATDRRLLVTAAGGIGTFLRCTCARCSQMLDARTCRRAAAALKAGPDRAAVVVARCCECVQLSFMSCFETRRSLTCSPGVRSWRAPGAGTSQP